MAFETGRKDGPSSGVPDLLTTAYRYGLLPPLDWGEDCDAQLRMQTDLWNRLVEIARAHVESVRTIAASDPEVARLQRKLTELLAELTACQDDACRGRVRELLRENAGALKSATKAAYAQHREELRELSDRRYAAAKAARQAANASGLWWGNANAVVDAYEAARGRALKTGAELHFRRHDGSGRLVNQIQGGMSVAALWAGAHSQARLGPPPEGMRLGAGKRSRRIHSLTVTAYTTERGGKRRNVTFPIVLDRPLPDGAVVKYVGVHRQRLAGRWRWHATFTLTGPAEAIVKPRTKAPKTEVAVNLGWRMTASGLRVATVLRADSKAPEFVHLPDRAAKGSGGAEHIADAMERLELWVSRRDLMRDLMHRHLGPQDWTDAPESVREMASGVFDPRAKPNAARLARLLGVWRAEAAEWRPELRAELAEWNHEDRRRWHNIGNLRQRIADRRRKHYEAEVLRLCAGASEVRINVHDMAETAEIGSGLPPPARSNRVRAAPSEFRAALANWCRRTRTPLVELTLAHDACAACGARLAIADRAALYWSCRSCGAAFDQDEHYCRLLLGFERRGDAERAGTARSDRNGGTRPKTIRANRRSRSDGASDRGMAQGRSRPEPQVPAKNAMFD